MSNKILDDMRDVMRRRHYSVRTERSYCEGVKRFPFISIWSHAMTWVKGEEDRKVFDIPGSWHHLDPSPINKAITNAVRTTCVRKQASAHTFRHSLAMDLLRRGTDICTIQKKSSKKDKFLWFTCYFYLVGLVWSRVVWRDQGFFRVPVSWNRRTDRVIYSE